jgi:hypothetical protein
MGPAKRIRYLLKLIPNLFCAVLHGGCYPGLLPNLRRPNVNRGPESLSGQHNAARVTSCQHGGGITNGRVLRAGAGSDHKAGFCVFELEAGIDHDRLHALDCARFLDAQQHDNRALRLSLLGPD